MATGSKTGCVADELTARVVITIGGVTFDETAAVPLVYMDRTELSFTGYPSNNAGVVLTQLHKLPCFNPSRYQHATAKVMAFLTDGTSYVVTAQTSVSSQSPVVVRSPAQDDVRMEALSAGAAVIDSVFGSTAASATLTVTDAVVAAASLTWSVDGIAAENTVKGIDGSTHPTTVNVGWAQAAALQRPHCFLAFFAAAAAWSFSFSVIFFGGGAFAGSGAPFDQSFLRSA